MKKVYIWSFALRISHFIMIISFFGAYFSKGFIHAFFGLLFGALVILRIIWGFVGTKYSRFKDFELKGLFAYLKSVLQAKHQNFIGHNPASSLFVLVMLGVSVFLVVLGYLASGSEEGVGYFAFMLENYSSFAWIKDAHEVLANALLAIVCVHICGAFLDCVLNKAAASKSMINGYKNSYENVEFHKFHRLFSAFWLLVILLSAFYLLSPKNTLFALGLQPVDYKAQNSDFAHECAQCHTLYAPFMQTSDKHEKIMANLENHFGDDASIDDEINERILEFLRQNSAEKSDSKWAIKFAKNDDIAITSSPFWQKAHESLDKEIFKRDKIKSKANCAACHENIEKGLISKALIKYEAIK